ncbi:MAG: hypothetical protein J0G97_21790, partial [Rhizobium pusense]|nr:hypothetical protein [Agrobacterium pusense]
VSFDDIVGAQQNLGMALQTYLTALDAQWKAVVDRIAPSSAALSVLRNIIGRTPLLVGLSWRLSGIFGRCWRDYRSRKRETVYVN